MTIFLALLASLFIGVSDFLGGTASRTRSPLETSLVVFLATLVTLVPIATLLGASDLTVHDLGLGAVSGLTTSIAYVGFFAAIGHGRISIVAPISAAVTALLPAIAGLAAGNTLATLARWGVLCALLAIPLVAYETGNDAANYDWSTMRQVIVSILCGVGFAFYFICIGHTHRSSGLWPTVATLVVAIAVTIPVAARGSAMPSLSSLSRPALAAGMALGVADSALTTALQRGPLTVASVLGNLYPLVTIALGVTVLGERVRLWHAAGIALAVAGVAMIAVGQ
ncbi:MAG TPA: DMT family transporter [Solirubrobacteraceae bacterium]|jgi:drug/metabolite transporter (DMT)-like permease